MKPLPPKLRQALLYQLRAAVQQRPDASAVAPGDILELLKRQQFEPPNKATLPDDFYYPVMERRSA